MTELSPQAFPSQIQLRSRLKGMRNGYATEHLPALTLMFPGANRGKNIYSQWVWWRWRGLGISSGRRDPTVSRPKNRRSRLPLSRRLRKTIRRRSESQFLNLHCHQRTKQRAAQISTAPCQQRHWPSRDRGLCRILLCRLQTQGRETVCRSYSLPGTFLTAREECKIHQKL